MKKLLKMILMMERHESVNNQGRRIPDLLTKRKHQFEMLHTAQELLENLKNNQSTTSEGLSTDEAIRFTASRIEKLEDELKASEAEAESMISVLSGCCTAWTFATLCYLKGFTTKEAAYQIGYPVTTLQMQLYRIFGKGANP